MNATMDLTARAVSLITAIQTTLLRGAITLQRETEKMSILYIQPEHFETILKSFIKQEEDVDDLKKSEEDSFSIKSKELVWISRKKIDISVLSASAVAYTTLLSVNLVEWIWKNEQNGINDLREICGGYPTPYKWREVISRILYYHPDERVKLASALQYIPIQVVLALGKGNLSQRKQRILQIWNINENHKSLLLDDDEIELLNEFAGSTEKSKVKVETLLKDNDELLTQLIQNNVPLSFEQVFTSELQEIEKNRERRISEQCVATSDKPSHRQATNDSTMNDPYEKAKQMGGLTALAFSGGGIRSATFNLGILQGLAQKNLITEFDYLSTVSGGGYIGSWLAAWIKRDGSVVKVTNRLCPDKSPDPLGEELRPIKWLRMFSNYFAPNASIMSADSWTIGITWLRNTLLNQVIIFLLLLSLLFAGNLLYIFWSDDIKQIIYSSWQHVLTYSLVLLIPVSLLAGLGMHAYHSERVRWLKVRREDTNTISYLIVIIAFVSAYPLSAWLSSQWITDGIACTSTYCKIRTLLPAGGILLFSLLIVAGFGKYINCISAFIKNRIAAVLVLLITAALTALVGLLCLSFAWTILEKIDTASNGLLAEYKNQVEFIIGLPLVLEVFSITLVARMAFLGRYFPDERREWWGRMGANIHRIAFLWILISASALLGKDFIVFIFREHFTASITAAGGWTALVLSTVKAAFSSKTSGKEETKNSLSAILNILGLLGPYLFALGLLIFLPGLITPLSFLENKIFKDLNFPLPSTEVQITYITLFCFFAAYLLSRQVGVNEFSMHHFYRNRLVRAYLGATRRYADRQRTYNPFTGFDMLDDEKLCKMKNEYGYYGPYPVLNVALNASQVTDLDRQDRKAESFIFSPLYCGFDFSMLKASADIKRKSYDYAYRKTEDYAYKDGGPGIGTAMAISGAAVSPNQGYHTSPATAFLLTVFNVQMGWWMGNPRKSTWQTSEPWFGLGYLVSSLIGRTSTRDKYVALSDGGHFDNMGLYEMIRRRCKFIVLCDAEQDNEFTCGGFANAIRRCRIDFGADIKIDISDIINRVDGRFSKAHYAFGDISYAGDTTPTGTLLYIKSSIMGDVPVDVYEYAKKNKTFPHQTTADQFFDEEQFESYRKLGLYIAGKAFTEEAIKFINE